MTDVSKILKAENSDPTLQLLALDPWILHFQPSDYRLLQRVDIFHTIHKLMLGPPSNQRTRRGSPAGTHRYRTPDDFDLLKHEKAVKEKVHKAAKTLFRLLGVNCTVHSNEELEEEEVGNSLQQTFFSLMATQLELSAKDSLVHEFDTVVSKIFFNNNMDEIPRTRSSTGSTSQSSGNSQKTLNYGTLG